MPTCEHLVMRVRRARAGEADEIAAVWLRSRSASVAVIPQQVHSEDQVRVWFHDVVLPMREVWVADDDGVVVAVLVLEDEWIDQLYVAPGRTGQGIGGRLIAVAKRQRPSGLKLWTFASNVGARRFYERHGFVATGLTAGDNEENAPDVRYEWPSVDDLTDEFGGASGSDLSWMPATSPSSTTSRPSTGRWLSTASTPG